MEHLQPDAFVKDAAREPVDRFIEQMGLVAQAENMPRISGRMLGLFLIEGRRFGLRELAERLQVSRASISTNARLLSQFGLLERVATPGDRQDYYQLSPNPYSNLLNVLVERMNRSGDIIAEAAETLPPERAEACHRLREFAAFYRAAAENMGSLIKRFSGR